MARTVDRAAAVRATRRRPAAATLTRGPLWREAAVLLLILIAVDLLLGAGLDGLALADRRAGFHVYPHLALYRQEPADVLLLGDSRILYGVKPLVLMDQARAQFARPVRVLNLGLVGGTPQANLWLLQNVIKADRQPALIIYGMSEYEPNATPALPASQYAGDLATLGDYSQAFPDPTQTIGTQLGFLLGRIWPLYRARGALNNLVEDHFATGDPDEPPATVVQARGYVATTHRMTRQDVEENRVKYLGAPGAPGFLDHYAVQSYQADRFAQFLAGARQRGIAVVVVNMPITRVHESFLSPADYAAYRAFLQKSTAQYGVRLVDYNDHALWDEATDFRDTNHLNVVGAQKLSERLGAGVLIPALQALGWK